MTVTAIIPGLGLDRIHRTSGPETTPASGSSKDTIDSSTIAVNRVERPQVPTYAKQSNSGLGEAARENLFRAVTGSINDAQPSRTGELTEAEDAQVRELKARDSEVRRHEEAHARVGGQYAGQPTYTYQTGPDGKRYAIGGEVSIDVAPIPDDPKATIAKMDVVIAAALAPAEPSGQDRKVAALASRQRLEATAELAAERHDQLSDQSPNIASTLRSLDVLETAPQLDVAA